MPLDVMFVDNGFLVLTSYNSSRLKIVNQARAIVLQFENFQVVMSWLEAFKQYYGNLVTVSPFDCRSNSPHALHNRYCLEANNSWRPFGSFAPVRLGCDAVWLVDGASTYGAMARAMLDAKSEIFITGTTVSHTPTGSACVRRVESARQATCMACTSHMRGCSARAWCRGCGNGRVRRGVSCDGLPVSWLWSGDGTVLCRVVGVPRRASRP